MKKIQKLTIHTPAIINIAFITLLILPILVFLSIKQLSAGSLNTRPYCERQFDLSFRHKITPHAQKTCKSEFERITNEWESGQFTK